MKYIEESDSVGPRGWTRWVMPRRRGYKMACCDCGLVHKMNFRRDGKHILMQIKRDERATAAVRREMKKKR